MDSHVGKLKKKKLSIVIMEAYICWYGPGCCYVADNVLIGNFRGLQVQ